MKIGNENVELKNSVSYGLDYFYQLSKLTDIYIQLNRKNCCSFQLISEVSSGTFPVSDRISNYA